MELRAPLFPTSPSSRSPSELSWCPLPKHPVFQSHVEAYGSIPTPRDGSLCCGGTNLAAWNASSSRLYLWDPRTLCIHRLSLRFADPSPEEDDDTAAAAAIEAASPSEILLTDVHINFPINHISLSGEGSALLLAGSCGLFVVYVYDRVSLKDDSLVCRTVSVGSEVNFGQSGGLRIMHVSWHPHSWTHIGVLSSDSVLRLYDLSSALKLPEQEYYLQPSETCRSDNIVSKSPVALSFGGEHLWDRFSVFILFSDGSIYVLCPVVPFGSIFSWPSVEEIYYDVNMFGLKSSNAKAVSNSWFALTWVEATFPDLVNKAAVKDDMPGVRAHPYASMDASVSLQGPLCKVSHCMGNNADLSVNYSSRAVGFLYSSIGKDSVLVIAWSNGQLQIDALADEVQPLWTPGASPRIRVDSRGRILGTAMICESNPHDTENVDLVLSQGGPDSVWLGNPPPLLSLAIVDLALPKSALKNASFSLFLDPIVSKRIYCIHNGGIDLITLHFLPFSAPNLGANGPPKSPTVYPILGACDDETSNSVVCGFAALIDPLGVPRVVAVTPSYNCILLEVKQWNDFPLFEVDLDLKSHDSDATPEIISREILGGPKAVLVSESDRLRSLTAESIEGRSALHQYTKLFHEHYVEYAHKVYFELKHHGEHLKSILDIQHTRLRDVHKMLSEFVIKQKAMVDRVNRAANGYMLLERRLQNFRSLPGVKRKPLSRAEREFKAQLERLAGPEMDSLHSSVEALKARLRRYTQSSGNVSATTRLVQGRRNQVPDANILELKSSMAKLTLINSENAKKVKVIDHALRDQLMLNDEG